jgi:hypothetical protein
MGSRCTVQEMFRPEPLSGCLLAVPVSANRKRHSARQPFSGLTAAGLVLLTSACGSIPPANLVATPSPRADPTCKVAQPPVFAQSTDPVTRLADSLKRVRAHAAFPVALTKPESFKGVTTEAVNLVQVAQAREAAQQKAISGVSILGTEARTDATADALLDLLPWAGSMDAIPANLDQVTQLASKLIIDASMRMEAMNKLLPPEVAPPDTQTAPAGTTSHLMTFSLFEQFRNFKDINKLAAFRAFHLMALLSAAHIHNMLIAQPPASDEQLDTEVRVFNVARFLSAYFDAYFRGGQFLQVTFNEQDFVSTLATRIKHQLPLPGKTASVQDISNAITPAFTALHEDDFIQQLATTFQSKVPNGDVGALSTDAIQKLLQAEFTRLCAAAGGASATCLSTTLGNSAFITRAGLSVQFSGVSFAIGGKDSVGISHTYPQLAQFGPQLVRVFVEALSDANGQHLPGVPNSTACDPKNHLFEPDECISLTDPNTQNVLRIDMLAASAEAISTTGTGAILRGLGPAGLNNELVANMLETLAGVNARKITEKVLYAASNRGTCPLTPVALRVQTSPDGDDDE